MKKILFLLIISAVFPYLGNSQKSTISALWTDDHKIVLPALPQQGEAVNLMLTSFSERTTADLTGLCTEMSNEFMQWRVSENGKSLLIDLATEEHPDWSIQNWEMRIHRMVQVYLVKE